MVFSEVLCVALNPAVDRTVEVDGLRPGLVHRARHVGDRPGGKGVNVAVALAEQGHRVEVHGFLGRENVAGFEVLFSALGIGDRCLRLPGKTRVGIKIVDTRGGGTTDLNFPGLAPSCADLEAFVAGLDVAGGRWCVLAGSLPPGVSVDFYAGLVRRLRARGVRVAVDTSGVPLAAALEAGPDVVKPNVHELEELVGRELPDVAAVVQAARGLVARGVGVVAVSCGEDGSVLVGRVFALRARSPRIEVGSTVGAGDAMVAGLVAADLRGLDPVATARLATAFAVQALLRGREQRSPGEVVAEMAARVEVESL